MALIDPNIINVYILHWNRPKECLQTVKCFLEEKNYLSIKISILDNGSTPESLVILKNNLPLDVNLTQFQENKGWGGAFNSALRQWLDQKTSRYSIISAHDALLEPECLKLLIQSMENDPKIGIACPEYGTAEIPHFSPIQGIHFVPTTTKPKGTIQTLAVPHGTLMMFRQECLNEIGLFDERYFAYGDEYELGLRANRYNWKVAMVWGAIVVNPGSWTNSAIKSYLFARNSLLLTRDYGGWWQAVIRALLMVLNTLRLLMLPMLQKSNFVSDKFLMIRALAIYHFFINYTGSPPEKISK